MSVRSASSLQLARRSRSPAGYGAASLRRADVRTPSPKEAEIRLADFAELVTAALANVDARERLAASRARIVEAGYEERRRLGRDLRDGAQQALVGAVISLNLAKRRWRQAPDEARELVEEALEHMQSGIRDLRELAAGIHPSVLTDRGLSAALESTPRRCVDAGTDWADAPWPAARPGRDIPHIYVVAEALTNAAKHSRCSHVPRRRAS